MEAARSLALELGLAARFVQADLYDAPAAIPEPASFDLVFTTWGTSCWLPDVACWARVVAHFLRPGGALYFADAHPAAYVFDDMAGTDARGRPGWFASGLALVTAAISLWNTVYLGRALDALRRRGEIVPDALLAHIAPLGWQHINLTGDYLWNADSALGPDGFRLLRGMASTLPTAAAA